MNKKILRDLERHSGIDVYGLGLDRDKWETKLSLFAELIVQECMRMCDVAAVGYETHGHTKEANGCYSAKEYIEEHFGVEE